MQRRFAQRSGEKFMLSKRSLNHSGCLNVSAQETLAPARIHAFTQR